MQKPRLRSTRFYSWIRRNPNANRMALCRRFVLSYVTFLCLILPYGAHAVAGDVKPAPVYSSEPIGDATKEADGTIILDLHTLSEGAMVEAQFRYPPSHPDYAMISKHIGPLHPGEHVIVKPFE